MSRIVLFVEGEGERHAAPILVKRLISERAGWQGITLDPNPFRVGSLHRLFKANFRDWKRLLEASARKGDLGGVLLILDGDAEKFDGEKFCSARVARAFASEAQRVGAGSTFSVAVVFALQEFETWLIAGIASLAGKKLPDGRLFNPGAKAPVSNLEESPRDAKGWLGKFVAGGYRPTRDQAALTELVELNAIRSRQLRSFRRLESAVDKLVHAIRTNQHVVSPL